MTRRLKGPDEMKRFSAVLAVVFALLTGAVAGPRPADAAEPEAPKRPYYEYPGNYADEVAALVKKFKEAFGYDLVDFGRAWRIDEIKELHEAFAELPPAFHHLPGLPALYRLDHFMGNAGGVPAGEIPAATLPSYMTLHDTEHSDYKLVVDDQDLRVEFYNNLFYEDKAAFKNIVHHEMAHAFDLSRGFISVSSEWLALSKFRILNLPALDAKPGSDFLYTFIDDPGEDNYAPVSLRHLPTYSRGNLQEDFANSAAAYIHYPYFRLSHPGRYRFLREKMFGGRDYFPDPGEGKSFKEVVMADFDRDLNNNDVEGARRVMVEVSRGVYPDIEAAMMKRLDEFMTTDPPPDRVAALGLASCYSSDPRALALRQDLVRKKILTVEATRKDERCARVSRRNFEGNIGTWAPLGLFFFREDDRNLLQFLDPVLRLSHARGFHTRYLWRIFPEGAEARLLAQGTVSLGQGGNGSVRIDLEKSAGKPLNLPEGRPLILELGVERIHNTTFKTLLATPQKIRFVVWPWFNYRAAGEARVHPVFPLRGAYQHLN